MLNNYNDVQNALDNFVQTAGVNIGGAPHSAFWDNLDYNGFTTGNIPGVPGNWKILIVGDAANSNIIQILSGVGAAAGRYGQMPRDKPPYNPEQAVLIVDLGAWINAGCPNPQNALSEEVRHEQKKHE